MGVSVEEKYMEKVAVKKAAMVTAGTQKKSRSIPWHVKIRSNSENVRIFELLRDVLKVQRKRHILRMATHHRQYVDNAVDLGVLKRYLRNPDKYEYIGIITQKITSVTDSNEDNRL